MAKAICGTINQINRRLSVNKYNYVKSTDRAKALKGARPEKIELQLELYIGSITTNSLIKFAICNPFGYNKGQKYDDGHKGTNNVPFALDKAMNFKTEPIKLIPYRPLFRRP